MNGRWSSETHGSWTAVSRAPWLKAVVLLGKGDCWTGGGLFTWKSNYWLNDGYGHFLIRENPDDYEVRRDMAFDPPRLYGNECLGVYYVRLQRDGWVLQERRKAPECMAVFEKPLSHGWVLRKYAHETLDRDPGKGCYFDEHELESLKGSQTLPLRKWEWAEWDQRSLVWADAGCLYRAPLHRAGLGTARLLFDFNDLKFERREAPY